PTTSGMFRSEYWLPTELESSGAPNYLVPRQRHNSPFSSFPSLFGNFHRGAPNLAMAEVRALVHNPKKLHGQKFTSEHTLRGKNAGSHHRRGGFYRLSLGRKAPCIRT